MMLPPPPCRAHPVPAGSARMAANRNHSCAASALTAAVQYLAMLCARKRSTRAAPALSPRRTSCICPPWCLGRAFA